MLGKFHGLILEYELNYNQRNLSPNNHLRTHFLYIVLNSCDSFFSMYLTFDESVILNRNKKERKHTNSFFYSKKIAFCTLSIDSAIK